MKKLALALVCVALLGIPGAATADPSNNPDFNFSRTFEFDPGGTGCPDAKWVNGEGRPDSKGHHGFGLVLEKNCETLVAAAPGAVGNSIAGTAATQLGFDIRVGDPCTGGSPRFNLVTSDGMFHFVGGCGNDNESTVDGDWRRVRFDLDDPQETFPPVMSGTTIESVTLIADEEGSYHLDNIAVVGAFGELCAEKPGQSVPCQP
jgi:hypothetical protein